MKTFGYVTKYCAWPMRLLFVIIDGAAGIVSLGAACIEPSSIQRHHEISSDFRPIGTRGTDLLKHGIHFSPDLFRHPSDGFPRRGRDTDGRGTQANAEARRQPRNSMAQRRSKNARHCARAAEAHPATPGQRQSADGESER